MRTFSITAPDSSLRADLQKKIDLKTKPQGSLGSLEDLALKIGLAQQTLTPKVSKAEVMVFAGDHGLTEEGVSAFPSEVTGQMVHNFLQGGAAISAFSKQHDLELKVINAGVKTIEKSFKHPQLLNEPIGLQTKNILKEQALSETELVQAIELGASAVKSSSADLFLFGEMGIGNTSSASLITSRLLDCPLDTVLGAGTGVMGKAFGNKKMVLKKCLEKYSQVSSPLDILQTFGGFEIAALTGAFLQAGEDKKLILVDGFIVTSALLTAWKINPNILHYCLFSHQSDEPGHKVQMDAMGENPLLKLNLRLGEGTGAALAYPIVMSSLHFLNEMASFEEAGVSDGDD